MKYKKKEDIEKLYRHDDFYKIPVNQTINTILCSVINLIVVQDDYGNTVIRFIYSIKNKVNNDFFLIDKDNIIYLEPKSFKRLDYIYFYEHILEQLIEKYHNVQE